MANRNEIINESQITLDCRHVGPEGIVISIDLGATHSAVSLAFLSPGQAPVVRMVKRWQPRFAEEAKTPTVLAYRDGHFEKAGYKAVELRDNEEYQIAELFKPRLHPENRQQQIPPLPRGRGRPRRALSKVIPAKRPHPGSEPPLHLDGVLPPLPEGITLATAYCDYFKYLLRHTEDFVFEYIKDGKKLWTSRQNQRTVVLTTPNGWGHREQEFLRDIAIHAGLVEEQHADRLLEFVTESEASVHFMLARSGDTRWLQAGTTFALVDAGGSTVDSTLYRCTGMVPRLILEELPGSGSLQAGGIFVDHEAHNTLTEKLSASTHWDELKNNLKYMVEKFESGLKRIFHGNERDSDLKVHLGLEKDDKICDIQNGSISFSLFEMRSTFDSTVKKILNHCRQLCSGQDVTHLVLVGGFGESLYLREQLRALFRNSGVEIATTEHPTKKAAAEGATIWFIRQLVVARAARFTLGTEHCPPYDPDDHIHQQRPHKVYCNVAGIHKIRGLFDVWVRKDEIIQANFRKIIAYRNVYEQRPEFIDTFSIVVYQWNVIGESPVWTHEDNGRSNHVDRLTPGLHPLCHITANLTDVLAQKRGVDGKYFWELDFEVAILFGGTKLQAQLQWSREDNKYSGPVTVFHKSTIV